MTTIKESVWEDRYSEQHDDGPGDYLSRIEEDSMQSCCKERFTVLVISYLGIVSSIMIILSSLK